MGRPRTRVLVEEAEELPLRPVIPEVRAKIGPGAPLGRPIPVSLSSAGLGLVVECIRHCFFGHPAPRPRFYFRCPGCGARRFSLFYSRGRLGCRGCLGLLYQSQSHNRWDGHLLERLVARVGALASRPGPKGKRYHRARARLERVEGQAEAWCRRMRANVAEAERQLAALRRCGEGRTPGGVRERPRGQQRDRGGRDGVGFRHPG